MESLIQEAKAAVGDGVITIANYLFPKGRVVSGDHSILDYIVEHAKDKGALQAKKLVVSGAFHSPR